LKSPTIEELASFTLKSYTQLLQYLREIYKIVPFCEFPTADVQYILLRHDIDYSLPAALKMAQIEKNLGIKSTYFVLLSTKFYNIREERDMHILKEISRLGHEIGLHYYPLQYRQAGRNQNKILDSEIRFLEGLLGQKVYSISRHGPWDRDPFASINKYINANHPFIRGDSFVHDSCRAWTPLQGLVNLLNYHPRRVQLLTHPDNWQDDKIDREQLLERFFHRSEKEVVELKEHTKKIWLTDPLVIEYDRLVTSKDFTNDFNKRNTPDQKLASNFSHYFALSKWYLINTSIGWSLHKTLDKIRSALNR